MKQSVRGYIASAFSVILAVLYSLSAAAQDAGTSEVYYQPPKHNLFYYVPLPAVIFGALFIAGIYLVWHYWANGKLIDDMS